jgi:hypothetical protein
MSNPLAKRLRVRIAKFFYWMPASARIPEPENVNISDAC